LNTHAIDLIFDRSCAVQSETTAENSDIVPCPPQAFSDQRTPKLIPAEIMRRIKIGNNQNLQMLLLTSAMSPSLAMKTYTLLSGEWFLNRVCGKEN
jgi:hypothetical protein